MIYEITFRVLILVEKNTLIEECQRMNIGFMTPFDWKPMKKSRRIYLPEYANPELNYVALILGNRGKTQRRLEDLTGCRISVQGRMASQNKRPGHYMDEQTHVLVQAETEKELLFGCEMVQKVLNGQSVHSLGASTTSNHFITSGNNELVALEAVLRDFCKNCMEEGHKQWNCPYIYNDHLTQKKNTITGNVFTNLKCEICGDRR